MVTPVEAPGQEWPACRARIETAGDKRPTFRPGNFYVDVFPGDQGHVNSRVCRIPFDTVVPPVPVERGAPLFFGHSDNVAERSRSHPAGRDRGQ